MEKEIPCPCSVKEVLSVNRAAAESESGIVWTAEHSKLREYSYFFKLERYHPGAIQVLSIAIQEPTRSTMLLR